MTTAIDEVRDTVNHLIEICHDGEQGFLTASQALPPDEALIKSELVQYSNQRREFAADLESEVMQMGEEPATHGTVGGSIHRGWLHLKHAITTNHVHAILAECERGEDAAVSAYRDAVAKGLSASVADMIRTQAEAVGRVHDRIRSLRDSSKSK
jgi:uncharacterized protein (TIGR02284 family)